MRFLLRVSRFVDALSTLVGKGMWWVSLIMVVVGAYNVIVRYLGQYIGMQLSANVYFEIQVYAFDLIFMLGAAYVLSVDGHVRVDIIYSRLGAKAKAWIDIFGTFAFLIPFCIFAIWFSLSYVERSWGTWEQSPNPGGLPRYPIKTVIIITFVMLIAQGLSETIKNVAFLRGISGHGRGEEPMTRGGLPDVTTDETQA